MLWPARCFFILMRQLRAFFLQPKRRVSWHALFLHILLILHCVCQFIAVSPARGRLAMLLRLPLPLPARTTAPRLFAAFLLFLWVAPLRPLPAHFFSYHGQWPSFSSYCCPKFLFSPCSGISTRKSLDWPSQCGCISPRPCLE